MPATKLNESRKLPPPFVGREREAAELLRLYTERKHVLILGPEGVGKSALVQHVSGRLRLVVCAESVRLLGVCEALEGALGLAAGGERLIQRKNRILEALRGSDATVVFDGVGWTTPKLSSFLGSVTERVPVWVVTRSEHSWDIGHFCTMLARFERVKLQPFHRSETQEMIETAARTGELPAESLRLVDWLHRRSGGSPLLLRELCEELATGKYDLASPYALRRLELDRRIHEVFPARDTDAIRHGGRVA